jgi:1,4-alpha-glucan branching enzyme
MADNSLIFVLDAQMPFIRHPDSPGCVEESRLFNAISYTYLPLLRSSTAIGNRGHPPFSSPTAFSSPLPFCEMLQTPLLQARYLEYLDRAVRLWAR